jgi:hypothetical protein
MNAVKKFQLANNVVSTLWVHIIVNVIEGLPYIKMGGLVQVNSIHFQYYIPYILNIQYTYIIISKVLYLRKHKL